MRNSPAAGVPRFWRKHSQKRRERKTKFAAPRRLSQRNPMICRDASVLLKVVSGGINPILSMG
jgi:hypothetical protein